MYFDTSYIAKFYLNEPDSLRIQELVEQVGGVISTQWAIAEFHSVLQRHLRERSITTEHARIYAAKFATHVENGFLTLVPVTEARLRKTGARLISAPVDLFLRAADALHLTTASDIGESEIWTNDRHMLAAAPYFGLTGRSV